MTVVRAERERRKFPRKNADFPVQLRPMSQKNAGAIHNSMTHDFSEGGMQLSSFYFYPVDSKMILKIFPLNDMEPISSVGRVVWIEQVPYQDRYKVGIEFAEMNYESRMSLKQMITSSNA